MRNKIRYIDLPQVRKYDSPMAEPIELLTRKSEKIISIETIKGFGGFAIYRIWLLNESE